MVNFFNAKKNPDGELLSPLMADADDSVMSFQSAGTRKSSKSNKSSKTVRSQEEQDEVDAKMGCCYTLGGILVKSIHLIDGIIGLFFVVYGSLIYTQFDDPAMIAAISCMAFGSVLLFASIMGGIGFTTKICKRVGLVLSAYTAPFVVFFYLVLIIAFLADKEVFFNYLTEHEDVMYLSSNLIATLEELLVFFYFVLLGLGAMEMMRYFALVKLRAKLVKRDVARDHISERAKYASSGRSGFSARSDHTDVMFGDVEEA